MKKKFFKPSVALVYDNLTTNIGGAELVIQFFLELFPNAHLYSIVANRNIPWLKNRNISTSFLQKLPNWIKYRHQLLAFISPIATESLSIKEDLVISICAYNSKGVITKPEQLHICYLLTPTRFLYFQATSALKAHKLTRLPILHQLAKLAIALLKHWDQIAIHRPDVIIAISQLVTKRSNKFYHRSIDQVIYPPSPNSLNNIDLSSLTHLNLPNYMLFIGRHVWYKRLDLVIKTSLEYKIPCLIAGHGLLTQEYQKKTSQQAYFRLTNESLDDCLIAWKKSQKLICFIGIIKDEEVATLMKMSTAVVMPGVEDFGIVGLQAIQNQTGLIINVHSGVGELVNHLPQTVALQYPSSRSIALAFQYLQLKGKSARLGSTTDFQNTWDQSKILWKNYLNVAWQQFVKKGDT